MSAPLAGLRVVDLSRVLAGPYCAQTLADHGADVVKIESPEGDENRQWGARAANGISCNFNSVNRGKRSIALDLKAAGAAEVLKGLLARADVVIQSFVPGTAKRLGVDYESVRALRPDVVYCSISGYGEKGEFSEKPGYDLMMQAFSGIMSTTGFPDGPPVRCGASFIDLSTGLAAYGAIMTALYDRRHTGQGAWVRVSLLETAVSMLGYHAVTWLQTGVLPRKEGSGVWHIFPYQAFLCSDGYLLAGATNDAAWRRLADALGHGELGTDERFATNDKRLENRSVLEPILVRLFASNKVDHWLERLEDRGVAVAPLHTLDQILTHPQVLANDMVVQVRTGNGAEMPVLGSPFKLSTWSHTAEGAAPQLGAHTDEVLKGELGLSDSDLARLRSTGAIRGAQDEVRGLSR